MQQTTTVDPERAKLELEGSRLIDHFKRAYQIIVGIAITNACLQLFQNGVIKFPDPQFWMFCTFFITVVPIFHGGDRSLDVKYLGEEVSGFWQRASYLWDVYMLLITAILFVKIAQAIPASPEVPWQRFYQWMAGMLFFDVAILIVDAFKSRTLKSNARRATFASYVNWIVLNLVVALICVWATHPSFLFFAGLSAQAVGIAVFVCALARTVLDYVSGRNFLFPSSRGHTCDNTG